MNRVMEEDSCSRRRDVPTMLELVTRYINDFHINFFHIKVMFF